jgi:hypothetical protein
MTEKITHNLTIEQRKQMTWPIEQVTDSQVVFIRAKQSEKDNRQLSNRVKAMEQTASESFYLKSDVHSVITIALLSIVTSILFGLAYREAGWSQWLLAGFFTAGITIPACLAIAFAVIRWTERARAKLKVWL